MVKEGDEDDGDLDGGGSGGGGEKVLAEDVAIMGWPDHRCWVKRSPVMGGGREKRFL